MSVSNLQLSALQRLSIVEEPQDAFAVSRVDDVAANWRDVPFQAGSESHTLPAPIIDPQIVQQRIYAQPDILFKPRQGATLTFTQVIGGTGVGAGDNTAAPLWTDQALLIQLKAAMGGAISGGEGSQVGSASTNLAFTPLDTVSTGLIAFDGASYTSEAGDAIVLEDLSPAGPWVGGEAIGWVNPTTNQLEIRELLEGDGEVSLRPGFSAAPSGGEALYKGLTFFPTQNPCTTVQFIYQGANPNDRVLFSGCQITSPPTITATLGELAVIQWSYEAAAWEHLPSGTLETADFGTFKPVIVDGEFRFVPPGGGVGQCLDIGSVTYQHNAPTFQKVRSYCSGVNTVAGFRAVRPEGTFGTVTFTLPFDDLTWFNRRDQDDFRCSFQHQLSRSGGPGQGVMISHTNCRIVDVQMVDQDGLQYQEVTARVYEDSFVTSSAAADLRLAPVRWHFM